MKGACLCRRVTVEIPRPPEYINVCNCDLCRKLGAAWAYFLPAEVVVTGETHPYRRDDLDEVWLAVHHCPTCGAATHYLPEGRADLDRMGVNTRLFAQDELDGIEVRFQDGREVETEDDEFVVTAIGHIGDGTAF